MLRPATPSFASSLICSVIACLRPRRSSGSGDARAAVGDHAAARASRRLAYDTIREISPTSAASLHAKFQGDRCLRQRPDARLLAPRQRQVSAHFLRTVAGLPYAAANHEQLMAAPSEAWGMP
jgi:hypothetical protein